MPVRVFNVEKPLLGVLALEALGLLQIPLQGRLG
jgi:hypothetical protein